MQKTVKITEIPNTGILKVIETVQEMAKDGWECNTDHRTMYLSLAPSLLDIELTFTKEMSKEEVNEKVKEHEDLLNAIDNYDIEEEQLVEDETDFTASSEYDEHGFVTQQELTVESPYTNKEVLIAKLNAAEKHKDLKAIAEKYGLEVDKNKKHPTALRNHLLSQLESQ